MKTSAKELGCESAFPVEVFRRQDGEILNYPQDGVTKREYFAGLAMQGAIASLSTTTANAWAERGGIIKSSVEMADALLAELSKEQP